MFQAAPRYAHMMQAKSRGWGGDGDGAATMAASEMVEATMDMALPAARVVTAGDLGAAVVFALPHKLSISTGRHKVCLFVYAAISVWLS